MKERSRPFLALVSAGLLVALVAGVGEDSLADEEGSLAGVFSVNNHLPEGVTLQVRLYRDAGEESVASVEVSPDDELPYSFAGLEPGRYRVRLVAIGKQREMALSETAEIDLTGEGRAADKLSADAIGVDGSLSGSVRVTGEVPQGRLAFVSARRSDMEHESFMPDGTNYVTHDLSREEIEAGQFDYEFDGLSYGVYRLQLTVYDYQTHGTWTYGEYPDELVIDLDHRHHTDKDFTADLTKTVTPP